MPPAFKEADYVNVSEELIHYFVFITSHQCSISYFAH
jgi:hypothetical protein